MPVLVRHAVVVRLAELGEAVYDLDALQRLAFEVCVDRQQFRLGIPTRVVERPAIPDRVGVEDLPLARESHRRYLDWPVWVGISANPGEDVTRSGSEEGLVRPFPCDALV
ncbi:hypothetical protein [Micromonospora globispora]|uniref:hypothetical protein n=1 Tax=Micromonospora globispora TaxID=1450148 RepID=UPI001403252B|nr:hypothetical protein [Micromonospora globispora]